jgi:hypothetical protein
MAMAILHSPLVQVLLWLVAAAAAVWILGPVVMYALGKSTFEVDVSVNPADAEPDGRDKKYESRFAQFRALGFRPAGRLVERSNYFTPMNWRWRSGGSRYIASPDGKTFVFFFRIGGGGPLRMTACSIFEQGGLIETASPGVQMKFDLDGNYKYDAVGDAEPEELLGMHARRVEAFTTQRKLTVKSATMREISAESESYSRIVLPKLKRGASASIPLGIFVLPALTMIPLLARGSSAARMAPVVLCACAAFYALMRWAVLPRRTPVVRMAVMMAVLMVPAMGLPLWNSPDRAVGRMLDSFDAGDLPLGRAGAVKRLVRRRGWACRPMLQRLENPATRPETRAIIHDALVQLKGSDLGEDPAAWQAWCAEVRQGR